MYLSIVVLAVWPLNSLIPLEEEETEQYPQWYSLVKVSNPCRERADRYSATVHTTTDF
jgi:hypothetical protein